jgi:hypothetical protein
LYGTAFDITDLSDILSAEVRLLWLFLFNDSPFIFRGQEAAMMSQMEAKLVKEKQTNERVSAIHCTSYVFESKQYNDRWIQTQIAHLVGHVITEAGLFTNL